jgi:hypothetical protein
LNLKPEIIILISTISPIIIAGIGVMYIFNTVVVFLILCINLLRTLIQEN